LAEQIHKSKLSESRRILVQMMQQVAYGRIEQVLVVNGEPLLNPPPRMVREIKFAANNGPRPESVKNDFVLKAQVVDLFAQMEALGNGMIRTIEVQRGLPFRMTVEEVCAA